MICGRCQRSLRNSEGLKCTDCDSKYHVACADAVKELRESGDRGYQWRCAVCQKSASKPLADNRSKDTHLIHMVNAISEKFELVNKIQLPKLHNDLAIIKAVVERLTVQNNDILQKINVLENKVNTYEKWPVMPNSYRRRNLNLAPRPNRFLEGNEYDPILQSAEKSVRFRTRRRSYLLHKMLRLLNNSTQAHRRH